jgi:hypothetical protein
MNDDNLIEIGDYVRVIVNDTDRLDDYGIVIGVDTQTFPHPLKSEATLRLHYLKVLVNRTCEVILKPKFSLEIVQKGKTIMSKQLAETKLRKKHACLIGLKKSIDEIYEIGWDFYSDVFCNLNDEVGLEDRLSSLINEHEAKIYALDQQRLQAHNEATCVSLSS